MAADLRMSGFKYPVLWAILILILSVIPAIDTPSISWMEPDKLVHVIFYIILTLLICRALISKKGHSSKWIILFIGLIVSVLYGGLIEIIQEQLLSWRSGDLLDFAADAVGAVLGSLIFIYFYAAPNKT